MKDLKKDSWIVHIAYPLRAPNSVSLCKLFWKTTLMLFLGWPIIILLIILASVVMLVGFGKRHPFYPNDDKTMDYVNIKHWPKVGGHQVMPLPIIICMFGAAMVYKIIELTISEFMTAIKGYNVSYWEFGIFGLSIVVIFLYWVSTTEYSMLIKEYIRSTKNKVCPIITIDHNS